jgi:hypothetical protein
MVPVGLVSSRVNQLVGAYNSTDGEDGGEEQTGAEEREEWCMEGFRDTMDYCGFSDLGYKGLPYTWDNRRECAQNVKVRLDRGLADEAWLDLFGESSVTHVQTTESDHCAVPVHITRSDLIRFHRINSDRNG